MYPRQRQYSSLRTHRGYGGDAPPRAHPQQFNPSPYPRPDYPPPPTPQHQNVYIPAFDGPFIPQIPSTPRRGPLNDHSAHAGYSPQNRPLMQHMQRPYDLAANYSHLRSVTSTRSMMNLQRQPHHRRHYTPHYADPADEDSESEYGDEEPVFQNITNAPWSASPIRETMGGGIPPRSPYDFRTQRPPPQAQVPESPCPPPVPLKSPRHQQNFNQPAPLHWWDYATAYSDDPPAKVPFPNIDSDTYEHNFYAPPKEETKGHPNITDDIGWAFPLDGSKPYRIDPWTEQPLYDDDPFAAIPREHFRKRKESKGKGVDPGEKGPGYTLMNYAGRSSEETATSSSTNPTSESSGDKPEKRKRRQRKNSFLEQAGNVIRRVGSFTGSIGRKSGEESGDANGDPDRPLRRTNSFRELVVKTLDGAANAIEATKPSGPTLAVPGAEDAPYCGEPKKKRIGRRKRALSDTLRGMADALRPEPKPDQSFFHH